MCQNPHFIALSHEGRALFDSGTSIFAARACHRFAALLEAAAGGARLPDMEGLEALRPVAAPPCVPWQNCGYIL